MATNNTLSTVNRVPTFGSEQKTENEDKSRSKGKTVLRINQSLSSKIRGVNNSNEAIALEVNRQQE